MKNIIFILIIAGSSLAAQISPYADEFLDIEWGAASPAKGGTGISSVGDLSSLYYNPSGLHNVKERGILFMHSEKFQSQLKNDLFAASFSLGNHLGFAAALYRSVIDGIRTTENMALDPNGVPIYDEAAFSMTSAVDNIFFVGAGKRVHKKWAVGLSAKIFHRNLGETPGHGISGDLGILHFLSSQFILGLRVRNATTTYLSWRTGTTEMAYPSIDFETGFHRDIPYFYGGINIHYQIGGLLPFDGVDTRPTESPANFSLKDDTKKSLLSGKIGIEYNLKNLLSFRIGRNAIYDLTAGCGFSMIGSANGNGMVKRLLSNLNLSGIILDYAFLSHHDLNESHNISLQVLLKD